MFLQKLKNHYSKKRLSFKLLVFTILFSAFITLFITLMQIYIDYKDGRASIENQFHLVVESHVDTLTKAVWLFDEDQINDQLRGIVSLPDILSASITTKDGTFYKYGDVKEKSILSKSFELVYKSDIKDVFLGLLSIEADLSQLYERLQDKFLILLFSQALKTFFVSLFILYMFQILITKHLEKMAKYLETVDMKNEKPPLELQKKFFKKSPDELDILVQSINRMQQSLYKTYKESKDKERMLQEQSKLAQMGEMISMIAHQWRQPLTAISGGIMNIKLHNETTQADTKEVDKVLDLMEGQVLFLSDTINDFRNFYKPDKEISSQSLADIMSSVLNMMGTMFESAGIEINIDLKEKQKINVYQSEVIQVLINILKNAYDNFREQAIKKPLVDIQVEAKRIVICDNGGGIPKEIIDQIFNPYFSTKDEKNGTGLGLYMSKIIIEEHHKGSLSVNS